MQPEYYLGEESDKYSLADRMAIVRELAEYFSAEYQFEVPAIDVVPLGWQKEEEAYDAVSLTRDKKSYRLALGEGRYHEGRDMYAYGLFKALLHFNNLQYRKLVEENRYSLIKSRLSMSSSEAVTLSASIVDDVVYSEFLSNYVGQLYGQEVDETDRPSSLLAGINHSKEVLLENLKNYAEIEGVRLENDFIVLISKSTREARDVGRNTGILMAIEGERVSIKNLATGNPGKVSNIVINLAGTTNRIEVFCTELSSILKEVR